MEQPVYLDYNATTPMAPEVVDAVGRAMREAWGNASSAHAHGRAARAALDRARGRVAALLGCGSSEIVFTSGGTESDNAAIVGVAEALESRGRHLVVSAVEHPAVEQPCCYLERRGWAVTRVGVDRAGRVRVDDVEAALRSDTVLVSLMHANNETGVLQPVREVAALARSRGIVVHTDAAQSVGKIAVDVDDLGVDLLTLAGHKLYGPKAVGALYVRSGTPFGGFLRGAGHEDGRRAGTESVPEIAGLGVACDLARREAGRREEHLRTMRDLLERKLRDPFPDLVVHGAGADRLPNTLYVALPGIDANVLVSRVEGVALASGAACHAGVTEPSGVLQAMGVPDELARGTLRLTVGAPTTAEEIERAAVRIAEAARVGG